jgi:hypothetical protein
MAVNDASVIWEIVTGGAWRPLIVVEKWFFAIAFICEAKKGIAACQVQRHLGVNYRTAWHLCHRIRAAMLVPGGVVEANETYIGPRRPRKGKPYVKKDRKDVVLGMIERGGRFRLVPVADAKIEIIGTALKANISPACTSSGISMRNICRSITPGATA